MCRPRQVAVLYSTMMITLAESITDHGAEFTAEQTSESIIFTDLDLDYCKFPRVDDVAWRGFLPLDRYWP
jgi:hypothetical protein